MKKILRRIVLSLITPEMVFFYLQELSNQSDNKIDDSIVKLVKSAYYNEPANMKKALLELLD